MTSLRARAGTFLPLLLLLPVFGSATALGVPLQNLRALQQAQREPRDTELDRYCRTLVPHLPPRGVIGFSYVDPPNLSAFGKTLYFLQYALAPRQIVATTDAEMVISMDQGRCPLLQDPRFAMVGDLGDGLRLFVRRP